MIVLKNKQEQAIMREAGQILAKVLATLEKMVLPGVTTLELEEKADKMITEAGAVASFRGQPGMTVNAPPFPAATCISVNEQVIHGIPSNRVIKEGDIVSIDCGVTWRGFIADSAISVVAGKADPDVDRLVLVTRKSLLAAIKTALPGRHLHDLSFAIQSWAVNEGLGIVKDFCGHGVGRSLHEDPPIPNYGKPGTGPLLRPGMTLAVEPMFNLGTGKVKMLKDGWTVVTADGKPSAHWEHTLLITDGPAEVLTWRPGEVEG